MTNHNRENNRFMIMKKLTTLATILFISFLSTPSWSKSEVDLLEVKLLNNLDDKRGFCIDIKGHKFRAKISRGVQAHTCYSYQGEIAVDQGLDANKLKQKTNHLYEITSNSQFTERLLFKKNKSSELDPLIVMAKFYPWIIQYSFSKGMNPDSPRYLSKVTKTF